MVPESGRLAGHRLLRFGVLAVLAGALATSLTVPASSAGDHFRTEPAEGRRATAGRHDPAASANQAIFEHSPLKFSAIHIDGPGATTSRQVSSALTEFPPDAAGSVLRLIAIPDCDALGIAALTLTRANAPFQLSGPALSEFTSIEEIVRIRDQTVAVIRFDLAAIRRIEDPADPWTGVAIDLTPLGSRGPVCRNTGPFTHALERGLVNYDASGDAEPVWIPPRERGSRIGTVTYCSSVADCAAAGVDVLLLVAEDLAGAAATYGFAAYHASYLGLNIGIVDAGGLSELTPEAIRGFIQGVYDTQSAEHFGDGHLGFVLLLGDAYADDNETTMIPSYYGYGGTEVASDHYYACVSGDDDFEDVMIGRLSAGNSSELSTVVAKVVNYMPHDPLQDWYERVLLVAGLFYTVKDDYVALFDEYEEILPDGLGVDRVYRHDFASNGQCAQAVVDAINDGYLFVDYAGDGWKFTWAYTLDTSHIPLMQNADRLPIVLSMACMTGWFDNTTDTDGSGSYDCLAEQLVNASGRGAIACLAAPRSSDGGIFRTITKKLLRAAFDENCVFLGETIEVAKLLHLQDEGEVNYVRHFNLFGDPALIFAFDTPPDDQPDLVVRPHDIEWSTELPGAGEDLIITVPVRNQSQAPATDVTVRASSLSGAGSYDVDAVIPVIDGWSVATAELVVPMGDVGDYVLEILADPDDQISELSEENNSVAEPTYAYPHLAGFPVDIGAPAHGPCAAHLSGAGKHVLIPDADARLLAFANDGTVFWETPAGTGPLTFDHEIGPAVGDLDGDGTEEVVFTKRMALAAVDAAGGELWTVPTQDPLGYPVLADADADGDLDVLLATIGVFGAPCRITAIDEGGQEIWVHEIPASEDVSTCPVAGDFDLDGRTDVAYGTSEGRVTALSCAQNPPVPLWGPLELGSSEVTVLGLGDVDGDGRLELVAADETLGVLNAEDGSDLGWDLPVGPGVVTIALGDVDDDDVSEIIAGTSSGELHLIAGGTVTWSVALSGVPGMSASIADIDADGGAEILVGTDAGYLHVLTLNGEDYVPPMPIPGECSTPFVGNLTGDTRQEVVVSSCDGLLLAFGFEAGGTESTPEWAGLGRSARRGGVHVQPLSGTITANTILAGHYRVTDDVLVEAGATLTIASETILEFESDPPAKLEIDGAIQALGHPGGEIVLTGESSRSTWGGLELRPGSIADLASCRVSDAATGIHASQASVTVADCEFAGAGTGLDLVDCSLDARTSAFSQCDSVGMYIDGGVGSIVGCAFSDNGAAGIECRECDSHEIRGSAFTGAVHGDGARLTRYSDVIIDSCAFDQNASNGLLVRTSAPTITRSSFSDNGLFGIHCIRLADPYVSWCTISGNSIGLVSESGSSPNLGNDFYPESGYNSIVDNQVAAAANYASTSVPIYARRNWWGTPTPYGRIFIGYVAYSPWLTEPPDEEMFTVYAERLPTSYQLLQNNPNPFNPTTTVTYEAPAGAGRVEIAIYDVAGRRVATLHSGECTPGKHEIVWNSVDDRGNVVASGVYFVRMSAPDHTSTRKMTLLK